MIRKWDETKREKKRMMLWLTICASDMEWRGKEMPEMKQNE